MNQKLSDELAWRGFVNQTTYKDPTALDAPGIRFYWGVDPSAPSMTIGNLAMAMMVRHFINYGHQAVLLVGGATGLIGDPDGKAEERNLKSAEEIAANKAAITEQYRRIFAGSKFEIVDNYDWFKSINYLDFLRDVGKHVPMRQMLGREFVQSRLSEDGAGISYAEFSYALIQGYDFVHLFKEKGVTLQVAGSDQWGNSIAGVDLVRRLTGQEAHVWSAPLITNKSTGKKFGKTEDGAVWLDEKLTSVYQFYQFWLNVDDEGVGDYLKVYTMLPRPEIEQILEQFNANKSERLAQKTLAYEVTKIVHGQPKADAVRRVTQTLFGDGSYEQLEGDDFELLKKELPMAQSKAGSDLIQSLVETGLAGSNSEARRFLQQKAVYLNGQQVGDDRIIQSTDALGGRYAILRRGKNANAVLEIQQ